MMTAKQRLEYLRNRVQSASREELVLMLFDGCARFMEQGRKAMQDKNLSDAHEALLRAQAIIMELLNGLDQANGGEIAQNLARLYVYSFQRLVAANLHRSTEPIDEVQGIFTKIREGWIGAMEKAELRPQASLGVPSDDQVSLSRDAAEMPSEDVVEIGAAPARPAPAPAATPRMPGGYGRPAAAPSTRLSMQG